MRSKLWHNVTIWHNDTSWLLQKQKKIPWNIIILINIFLKRNQHWNPGTTQKWSFIVLLVCTCTSIKLIWSTLMPGSHCIATPSVLTNDGRRFDLFNNVHQFIHWRMFMGKSDLGASYSPWRSVLKKTNTVCVHCQETTEICQYPLFTWKHTLECVFAQHNIHTFHINIKRIIY